MAELTPQQKAALELLNEGEEYVLFFFRKAKGLAVFDALKARGWFSPEHNPEPIEEEKGLFRIPDWPALDYLTRVAVDTNGANELRYAEEIIQILRNVTKPAEGAKRDNYRTWWRFAKILSDLPLDVIKEEDVDLISEWIDTRFDNSLVATEIGHNFLPKLLADPSARCELAYRTLDIFTQVHWKAKTRLDGQTRRDAVFRIDSYRIKKLLKKNAKELATKCGCKVADLLLDRLETVIREDDHDRFSYIWRPAIEDHQQNKTQQLEPENILLTTVREAATALIDTPAHQDDARKLIQRLLQSDLQTHKRLAFHLLNERFFPTQDILYKNISVTWFDPALRHELYLLLSNRFADFSQHEQDRIVDLINGIVSADPDEEHRKQSTINQRLIYLSAIKGKGHARADELYSEYSGGSTEELERPDFAYYMHAGRAEYKSPFAVDELLAMSSEELVKRLNTYQPQGWPSHDEEGLARTLAEATKREPSKFAAMLKDFVGLKPRFLVSILTAYQELSKTQRINWAAVLEFAGELVERGQLWDRGEEDKTPGWQPKKRWVVSSIADVIRDGFKDASDGIPDNLWNTAEAIVTTLLEREPGASSGDSDDALTDAINSARGRALESLLVYTVRRADDIRKKTGSHDGFWQQVQPLYDKEIEKTVNGNFEFSALAGRWLPNLHFLSKTWVEENIDKLFSTNSEQHWRHAVQGYSYVSDVYRDLYLLLREHGDFKRVIDSVFDREKTRDKYLQHIVVAYLHGDETLEDGSLFRHAIDKWRSEDLHEILWFLWTFREHATDSIRARAIALWQWLSDRIKGQETEHEELLADLSMLTAFLTKVGDKEKTLLLQSAPYVGLKHHTSLFVEDLDALADTNPKAIADVYKLILTKHIPDYPEEHIRSLVTKLYKAGLKLEADEICDKYRANMYEFLKDTYEQFR